jgi:hypothetical protein
MRYNRLLSDSLRGLAIVEVLKIKNNVGLGFPPYLLPPAILSTDIYSFWVFHK